MKRRRNTNSNQNTNFEDNDFSGSTGRSKKRAVVELKKTRETCNGMKPDSYNQCIDDDLDFYDYDFEMNGSNTKASSNDGRVLPLWSAAGNGIQS